jgi:hypothetical protein
VYVCEYIYCSNYIALALHAWPCHGSGDLSPASHPGGPGSRPGSPCDICGAQGGIGTGFSPNYSGFLCQYHSTMALQSGG